MTSTLDTAPPPPPEGPEGPPAKPSSFDRIIGVLMAPSETFESIAARPNWGVPLIIILVIAVVSGVLVATRVNFNDLAREAMEMNPNVSQIPADRVDSMIKVSGAMMKISAYASPFLLTILFVVVAGVLLVSFRLFGGSVTFLQAFSATIYAWIPRVIKSILGAIVVFTRPNIDLFGLQNPIMSNLGFLADPKTNPVAYTLLASVDLFTLWSLALLIIGFAVAARLSRGKSAAIVIGWWIIVNLFSLIGPAMQMMRR